MKKYIVIFDPFSYTWHYNQQIKNELDRNEDIKVISLYEALTLSKKSKFYRFFLVIKFYLILTFISFKQKNKVTVFWNISFFPILDTLFLMISNFMNVSNVLIMHNTHVNHGTHFSIRNIGYKFSLNFYNKIISHDSSKNLKKIFSNKIFLKIHFLKFPLYSFDLKPKTKNEIFTIGFFGIISPNKNLSMLPSIIENIQKIYDLKIDLKIVGKHIYDVSNVIKKLKTFKDVNLLVINDLISDELFNSNLYSCDLLLMPYKNCSGSALLSQAISMRIPTICSDLNYFKEFEKNTNYVYTSTFKFKDFKNIFELVLKKFNNNLPGLNKTENLSTMSFYCKQILKNS